MLYSFSWFYFSCFLFFYERSKPKMKKKLYRLLKKRILSKSRPYFLQNLELANNYI